MKANQFELQMLKELLKNFESPDSTVAVYRKYVIGFFCLGATFIAISIWLTRLKMLSIYWSVIGGSFGGLFIGLGFSYSISMQQIPFFTKYLRADIEAIKNRIKELKL